MKTKTIATLGQDIQEAQNLIPQGVKSIAKIERKQALEHIDDMENQQLLQHRYYFQW